MKLKYKYQFLIILILLILFLFALIQFPNYKTKYQLNLNYLHFSDIINYKGEKVLKSKLLNDYLSKVSDNYLSEKNSERNLFNNYFYLADYKDDPLVKKNLKTKFIQHISKIKKQNITKIDIFYLSYNLNFGNNLIVINNAIFYCQIVECHQIIINKNTIRKRKLLLNETIYDIKNNITIMLGKNVDCNKNNIICFYEIKWNIYYPRLIIPQVRVEIIKSEILKNLPKVNIMPDELFIHIRGGDIFRSKVDYVYAQPPLCFYERIMNNNKNFKNIYLISMDRANVIVNTLLNKYKNIIHSKNDIEYDISLLCHAYNIVISISSFVLSAIKLNDNLKNIWEFDNMRLSSKFLFLHHHIFKYRINYQIHTMKSSDNYISKMFKWISSKEQINLMLEEKCPFDFSISNTNK